MPKIDSKLAVKTLVGFCLLGAGEASSQATPLERRIPFQGRVVGAASQDLAIQVRLVDSSGSEVYGPESLTAKADSQGNFVFLIGSSANPCDSSLKA